MGIRFKVLTSLALVFAATVWISDAGPSHGQASKPAAAHRVVELIMFEQFACEWCEAWDADVGVVYHKTTEGKRAPLRKVDIHSDVPQELKPLMPVVYTPTFVLIENGVEIGRIRGYPGEDFFWGMLDQMMNKLSSDNVQTQSNTVAAKNRS